MLKPDRFSVRFFYALSALCHVELAYSIEQKKRKATFTSTTSTIMKSTPPNFATLNNLLTGLAADQAPLWGTMNASQMCHHCSSFIKLSLGEKKTSTATSIIGFLFGKLMYRYFSTKTIYTFPKNMNTFPEIKQRTDRAFDIEAEKILLRNCLERARKVEGKIRHPLYGNMPAPQIQHLILLHTAYHFRQFGLLD